MAKKMSIRVDLEAGTALFFSEINKAEAKIKQFGATSSAAGKRGFSETSKAVELFVASTRNLGSATQLGITALEGLGSSFGTMGGLAAGATLAVSAFAVSAFKIVESSGKAAEQISNLSDRMGISIQDSQKLSDMSTIAGVGIDGLSGLTRKLSNTLSDGGAETEAAVRRLEKMGITVLDSGGKFRSSIDIIREFSEAFNKFPDHASRVKALNDVFGRGAIELLPLIKNFADLERQVNSLGPALSDNVVERLAKADDALDRLGIAYNRLKATLASHLVVLVDFTSNGVPFAAGGVAAALISGTQAREKAQADAKAISDAFMKGSMAPFQQQRDAENAADIARGSQLINQFRNQITEDSLQRKISLLQSQQNEARARAQLGGGAVPTQNAIDAVNNLERQIRQEKDLLKIIQDRHAEEEKIRAIRRDLVEKGETFLQIEAGKNTQFITSDQISKANQNQKIPTLRTATEQAEIEKRMQLIAPDDLAGGSLPGGVFISPSSERRAVPGESADPAFIEGLIQHWKRLDEIRLSQISQESEATIRLLELRSQPGGEMDLAIRTAAIRKQALEQEDAITGDVVHFREQSLRNELDMRLKIVEIERRQFDSIKDKTESLFHTLFTNQSAFGKQFTTTIRDAFLKPIEQSLAATTARILKPLIFGQGGQGGIAGIMGKIFPVDMKPDGSSPQRALWVQFAGVGAPGSIIPGVIGSGIWNKGGLFGGGDQGGGIFSALGGLVGSLFGGGSTPSVSSSVSFPRASGGPVFPSQSYLVGERGAEMFRPSVPGSIVPNDKLGGANHYYTIDARGTDPVLVEQRVQSAIIAAHNSAVGTSIQVSSDRVRRMPNR